MLVEITACQRGWPSQVGGRRLGLLQLNSRTKLWYYPFWAIGLASAMAGSLWDGLGFLKFDVGIIAKRGWRDPGLVVRGTVGDGVQNVESFTARGEKNTEAHGEGERYHWSSPLRFRASTSD